MAERDSTSQKVASARRKREKDIPSLWMASVVESRMVSGSGGGRDWISA